MLWVCLIGAETSLSQSRGIYVALLLPNGIARVNTLIEQSELTVRNGQATSHKKIGCFSQ